MVPVIVFIGPVNRVFVKESVIRDEFERQILLLEYH